MDGNRRWAAASGLPIGKGHEVGGERFEEIVKAAVKLGIKFLTVYALSTENLKSRSKIELAILFKLLEKVIEQKADELDKSGVRIKFLGRLAELPDSLQRSIATVEEKLKKNNRLVLNIALNYGGRSEIIDAVRQIKNAKQIEEEDIAAHLYSAGSPDPDLIIRTGGEQRLSNFLLWQGSYSELFFTDTLWPDFGEEKFVEALEQVSKRKRRFGR
jgi:undecaprenyl diphosphate synthase